MKFYKAIQKAPPLDKPIIGRSPKSNIGFDYHYSTFNFCSSVFSVEEVAHILISAGCDSWALIEEDVNVGFSGCIDKDQVSGAIWSGIEELDILLEGY